MEQPQRVEQNTQQENKIHLFDVALSYQLSRRWSWTAMQAYRQWGRAAGDKVAKAVADDKGSDKFWFHHRLQPRNNRDPQRADKLHMAY